VFIVKDVITFLQDKLNFLEDPLPLHLPTLIPSLHTWPKLVISLSTMTALEMDSQPNRNNDRKAQGSFSHYSGK
jgi:hypothetical protein